MEACSACDLGLSPSGKRWHGGWNSRLWLRIYAYEALSESRYGRESMLNKGGDYLPRLNISGKPIANKYREGKLKSTLKRESTRTWNCGDWRNGHQLMELLVRWHHVSLQFSLFVRVGCLDIRLCLWVTLSLWTDFIIGQGQCSYCKVLLGEVWNEAHQPSSSL